MTTPDGQLNKEEREKMAQEDQEKLLQMKNKLAKMRLLNKVSLY